MVLTNYFHIAHILGLATLFVGFGVMAGAGNIRPGMKWHGLGLVIMFITGFGMLGSLHLMSPMPTWAWIKIGLWLVLGVLPTLAKRKVLSMSAMIIVAALIATALATLGYIKQPV